ncbi:hypothetical protein E2C01_019631 [Portunus trituberculatus]|uniref:Uncharacterized protein n=1 Tax=Portunus trituberculatus TaxID=210409 RepID=A0A5B7DXR5_PORTR|nr:hypothetical protein [Portunus trituberculatus]
MKNSLRDLVRSPSSHYPYQYPADVPPLLPPSPSFFPPHRQTSAVYSLSALSCLAQKLPPPSSSFHLFSQIRLTLSLHCSPLSSSSTSPNHTPHTRSPDYRNAPPCFCLKMSFHPPFRRLPSDPVPATAFLNHCPSRCLAVPTEAAGDLRE